jgi:hypothetical protein
MPTPTGGSASTISCGRGGSIYEPDGVAGEPARAGGEAAPLFLAAAAAAFPGGAGLPAREPDGVPLAVDSTPGGRLIFFRMPPAPSDISPAVASPSLVEPAPVRPRCVLGRGVVPRLSGPDVGLDFFFFRVDSLPLESEARGEPGRLRFLPFLAASAAAAFFALGRVGALGRVRRLWLVLVFVLITLLFFVLLVLV